MSHLYLPPPNGKKPPAWRSSPAKQMLKDGIISALYPTTIADEVVYGSSLEFRQYKWENFKTNIKNLRAAIDHEFARAVTDATKLAADKQHRTPVARTASGYPIWAGSVAEKLLKEDVDAGNHLLNFPRELRESKEAYKEWPLTVFRDHIQQEVKGRKTQAYWLHRDKKASASEPWPTINSK